MNKVNPITCVATSNQKVEIPDNNGRNIVLYFYPKDDTPGCTIEGNDFAALNDSFVDKNTVIYGMFSISGLFQFFHGLPEAQEVFKNHPGPRGVIFPKYEPIPSHGNPFIPQTTKSHRTLTSQITISPNSI